MTTSRRVDGPRRERQYLLGVLPDEEAEAFESEFFADRAAFDAVDAAADALVDEFLDNQLDPPSKARVQTLLASEEWQDRLRFAHALRACVHDDAAAAAAARSLWSRVRSPVDIPGGRWMVPAAAAASVVLALGVSTGRAFWMQQQQLSEAQRALSELASSHAEATAAARASDEQLNTERTARQALAERLEGMRTVAVMLVPGTRSDAGTTIQIAADAGTVNLTMAVDDALPVGLTGGRFTLRAQGRQVAGGLVAAAAISPREGAITVTMPAVNLTTGQYELTLELAADGRFTEFARYSFFVTRR